jgi:hypothetical protein
VSWRERERAFLLATVCVEWYEDRVRHWWSAWLLLWTAIGLAAASTHHDTY